MMRNLTDWFERLEKQKRQKIVNDLIKLLETGELSSFIRTMYFRSLDVKDNEQIMKLLVTKLEQDNTPTAKLFLKKYDKIFTKKEKTYILKKVLAYETIKKL